MLSDHNSVHVGISGTGWAAGMCGFNDSETLNLYENPSSLFIYSDIVK